MLYFIKVYHNLSEQGFVEMLHLAMINELYWCANITFTILSELKKFLPESTLVYFINLKSLYPTLEKSKLYHLLQLKKVLLSSEIFTLLVHVLKTLNIITFFSIYSFGIQWLKIVLYGSCVTLPLLNLQLYLSNKEILKNEINF